MNYREGGFFFNLESLPNPNPRVERVRVILLAICSSIMTHTIMVLFGAFSENYRLTTYSTSDQRGNENHHHPLREGAGEWIYL